MAASATNEKSALSAADFRFDPTVSGDAASTPANECPVSALSREVGVATEMLLTKAEQVSDDGACAAGLRLKAGTPARLPVRPKRSSLSETALWATGRECRELTP